MFSVISFIALTWLGEAGFLGDPIPDETRFVGTLSWLLAAYLDINIARFFFAMAKRLRESA